MSRTGVRRTVAVALGVLVATAVSPVLATGAAVAASTPLPTPAGVTVVDVADVALSGDGRWIVYAATAQDGDAEPRPGLFLADRTAGTAVRLDVDADARIGEVDMSDDARRIVFSVGEHDVVAGQSPVQVHVHDRTSGTTTLVSALGGTRGEAASWDPQISADGAVVAFATEAPSLLGLPASGAWVSGVVATEVGSGELEVVSGPGGRASYPALSGDGRLVAFSTDDPSLPGHRDSDTDVVVHDRRTGASTLVTTDEGGGFAPSLSADGSTVVWSKVVATSKPQVQFYGTWATDLGDGSTARVDVDAEGVDIRGITSDAVVSADGRRVLFSGLDRTGTGFQNLYLHDRATGRTGIVPVTSVPAALPVMATDLSADGRVAAHSTGFPRDGTVFWTGEIGELLPVPPAPPREPAPELILNTARPVVKRTSSSTSYAFTLARAGTWESNVALDHRYQWLRDGEQVTDSVGTTYEVGPDDIGHVISLREVVQGPGGTVAVVESKGVVARKASSRLRVKVKRPRGRAGAVVLGVRLTHAWGVRPQGRVVVRYGKQTRRVSVDEKGRARVRLAPGRSGRRVLKVSHRATPIVKSAAPARRVVRVRR